MNPLNYKIFLILLSIINVSFSNDISTKISYPTNSNCNGKIDLTIIGGYPSYDITWTGPNGVIKQTSGSNGSDGLEDIDNLCPDAQYCVSITDALCGVLNYCWTLTNCPTITLTNKLNKSNPSNCSANDGWIYSQEGGPQGGTWPYTLHLEHHDGTKYYQIPPSHSFNNLKPGKYKLIATDANGCTGFMDNIYLTPEEGFTIKLDELVNTCNGNTGKIKIYSESQDFSETFNYQWSNGVNHNNIPALEYSALENLGAGEYCVTITSNSTTCTLKECYNITNTGTNTPLQLNASIIHSCKGQSNGKLSVAVTGGTPPYTKTWTPNVFEGFPYLDKGTYCLTVTDICGSYTSACYEIKEVEFNINYGITCKDQGWAELTINNALNPVSINWVKNGSHFNRGSDTRVDNLSDGSYSVYGRDKNDCTFYFQFSINYIYNNYIAYKKNNSTCNNENQSCDGIISIGTKGNKIYSYLWEGPNGFTSTSKNISNLCPGLYKLTATDLNQCKENFNVIICCCNSEGSDYPECDGPRTQIEVQKEYVSPVYNNSNDGSIKLNVNGGLGNYIYNWSGPNGFNSNEKDINNLGVGNYCVTITDGCQEISDCTNLISCDSKNITINGKVTNTCGDYKYGSIEITIGGQGEEPFTYSWSNGEKTKDIKNLEKGFYCLIAVDKGGCTIKEWPGIKCFSVQVNELTPFVDPFSCGTNYFCNGHLVKYEAYTGQLDCKRDANKCNIEICKCPLNGMVVSTRDVGFDRVEIEENTCSVFGICPGGGREYIGPGTIRSKNVRGFQLGSCGPVFCSYDEYCEYFYKGILYSKFVATRSSNASRGAYVGKGFCSTNCCEYDYYCGFNYLGRYCDGCNALVNKDTTNQSIDRAINSELEDIYNKELIYPLASSDDLIMISPNPVHDFLNIKIRRNNSDKLTISIYNSSNLEVINGKYLLSENQNNILVDCTSLVSGIYFIYINTNGKIYQKKFIKIY